MEETLQRDRRKFLRQAAVGAGALWVTSLQDFAVRKAFGAPHVGGSPYGPISPTLDQTTGLPLLQLPTGFRYLSYGMTGDVMDDGVTTPSLHDGMAVVKEIGFGGRLSGPFKKSLGGSISGTSRGGMTGSSAGTAAGTGRRDSYSFAITSRQVAFLT